MQQNTQASVKLKNLAEIVQGKVLGDENVDITGVGTINNAAQGDITFLLGGYDATPIYRKYLPTTKATAVIVSNEDSPLVPCNALVVNDVKVAFAKIVSFLNPDFKPEPGIHPSAVIDQSAIISKTASVGANCVIEANAVLEEGVILGANCFVGKNTTIASNTRLHPNVTCYHGVKIGNSCLIQSGTVIGGDGFGYANDKGKWIKVPQIGGVIIGNNVEIGANTCIDRGAIGDTIINDNVILDNLIQIAHNVEVGTGTAMAACVGVAGSAKIGKHCLIGGGSGINGHLEITDQVNLIGNSGVARSIKKPGTYGSGIEVAPRKTWIKNVLCFHKLSELFQRVKILEQKLNKVTEEL